MMRKVCVDVWCHWAGSADGWIPGWGPGTGPPSPYSTWDTTCQTYHKILPLLFITSNLFLKNLVFNYFSGYTEKTEMLNVLSENLTKSNRFLAFQESDNCWHLRNIWLLGWAIADYKKEFLYTIFTFYTVYKLRINKIKVSPLRSAPS